MAKTCSESVINLWICRYCEINSNRFFFFVNIDMSCHLFFTSYRYCCLTVRSVTLSVMVVKNSRDNIHRANYKISTLCALSKPNCELAAVCKQSCTHCVFLPAISLHVPPHWETKDFLHKDCSGNFVDFVIFLWKLLSVCPVTGLSVRYTCLCAYCMRCSKWK